MTLYKKNEAAKLFSKISTNDIVKITKKDIMSFCKSCSNLKFFEEEIELKELKTFISKPLNPKAKYLLLYIQGSRDISMNEFSKIIDLFENKNTSVSWGFGVEKNTNNTIDKVNLYGLYGS